MEMHITYIPGYIRMISMIACATLIENWSLVTIQNAKGCLTRHVHGRVEIEGRYSTALVEIDLNTLTVETSPDRMDELIGPPGRDDDSQWLMGLAHTARGYRLIKNHLWSIMRLLRAMEKRHA